VTPLRDELCDRGRRNPRNVAEVSARCQDVLLARDGDRVDLTRGGPRG
jgi:hypothetical protein